MMSIYAGKELRLKQQYFFISASVQEAVAKYKKNHSDIRKFYEKATFQLNDTHPTVAVAELMRILMDEEGLGLGRGMGCNHKDLCLHQPYDHGRGTGEMADRAVLPPASAYLSDRRGDQPPLCG